MRQNEMSVRLSPPVTTERQKAARELYEASGCLWAAAKRLEALGMHVAAAEVTRVAVMVPTDLASALDAYGYCGE